MARSPGPFTDGLLVVASHNPGKVREIADLLRPHAVTVRSAIELGLDEPEETGTTFEENALIKARAAVAAAKLPALADDSGLAVDLLGGAPGIYSARLAGPEKDFGMAMERVRDMAVEQGATLTGTAGGTSPTAKFVCVLALAWPPPDDAPDDAPAREALFRGEVAGALVWPPRGDLGFGYDPIFQAHGQTRTFGEMEALAKHAMSHRADAFAKLTAALFAPQAE